MPIYEYKCDKGHLFEVTQRMSEDALTECQVCEAPVKRVFHPVAVHFKGSGFYNTDYGTRRRSREASENESKSSDGASKSDSAKSDSGKSDSGKSESGKSGSGKTGSSASTAAATD